MIKRRDYHFFHRHDDRPSSSDSESDEDDLSDVEEDWPASSHEGDSSDEGGDEDKSEGGGGSEEESEGTAAKPTGEEGEDSEDDKPEGEDGEEELDEGGEESESDDADAPVVGLHAESDLEEEGLEGAGPRKERRKSAEPTAVDGPDEHKSQWAQLVDEDEEERIADAFSEEYVVVRAGGQGKVLKCRVCPKVVCLSEESMGVHLKSKGHGRSLKKLAEGRLQSFINSEGEEEDDAETHAERRARMLDAVSKEPSESKQGGRRNKGRQRQRKRKRLTSQQNGAVAEGAQGKPAKLEGNRKQRRQDKAKMMQSTSLETPKDIPNPKAVKRKREGKEAETRKPTIQALPEHIKKKAKARK